MNFNTYNKKKSNSLRENAVKENLVLYVCLAYMIKWVEKSVKALKEKKMDKILDVERGRKMEFRPCIDIHNGKVKQIVGGSLVDKGNQAEENFVSEQDGSFYANLYKKDGLKGGHIIILNPVGSEYYEADVEQAMLALRAYPGGLQVGGGITNENAKRFIDAGASHVVVTSYVFKDGKINYENLNKLVDAVGKEHLVLDLSCRKKKDEQGDYQYYVVTDRWQKFTDTILDENVMNSLSKYCDEFLIHAVDVEGKANGVETELVKILSKCKNLTITYAGGVGNYRDLEDLKILGNNQINVTIGSALDLFGGGMCYENVLKKCKE